MKNKTVAGLLGIFLGDFGIHKFYLGKPGMGLLYLLFSWTAIPAVIGFIEGVMYLLSSEKDFQAKHGKPY
ncbi:TM2 domain-containing protein [Planococcus sp. APC 3906]|uniref:TM2 domain-containing protein n=1 Tax=Planococcus TaxID=1372 RepID=UPI0025B31069|nr:TM2 domain-containing protein [Planococcus sp. APC 3906]MDN3450614.1 TM2 domain-containing protein [Planococcus sp. APC 3906]